MKKIRIKRKLLSEVKKIAGHFQLSFSKVEIFRGTAVGLDKPNKRLLVTDPNNGAYFKTIDLRNVVNCAVIVDYRSINAGELPGKNMYEFIENVRLHLSHTDPVKSIFVDFYNAKDNRVRELRALLKKAKSWRDNITALLPATLGLRA